jgi:hypothetical protein
MTSGQPTVNWADVEAFQRTPEYLALGVLGRQRVTYAAFPEVEAWALAREARRHERRVYGRASTQDPDEP